MRRCDAILFDGMRTEKSLHEARLALSHSQHRLEHRRNSFRVDARAQRVRYCLRVCFRLGFAAVARQPRGAAEIDRDLCGVTVAEARQAAEERDADPCSAAALQLLHRVSPHDVADLVTEYARELVHPIGVLDQAAIHIYETAGKRERV